MVFRMGTVKRTDNTAEKTCVKTLEGFFPAKNVSCHNRPKLDYGINMSNTRFPYLYFLFGAVCGFLLGSSLERESSVIVGKIIFATAVLLIAFFWRRVEATAHTRHVEAWHLLRLRGKWYFIITRYLLLRGSVLFVVLIGPMYMTLGLSTFHFDYLALVLMLFAFITLYLGQEEWSNCEREYEILIIRQAAEQERAASALKN